MVDSAIICLENTDRHLEHGSRRTSRRSKGASEVALPELVSSLSTLLVLTPLAVMPGMSSFLFQPMALAVTFAMATAYILSRTLVPTCAAAWLKPKDEAAANGEHAPRLDRPGLRPLAAADRPAGSRNTAGCSTGCSIHRWPTVIVAYVLLAAVLLFLTLPIRREFFPQADAGAFEIYVRAPSGTRLSVTNGGSTRSRRFIKQQIPPKDLKIIVSEIGVTPDWSSAYTPNAGKMDTVVRVQLTEERQKGSYEYADLLRGLRRREAGSTTWNSPSTPAA